MRIRLNALTFVAMAAVSAVAFGAVQGLSVKRLAKEGQSYKYKMEGEVDFSGLPITITATVVERVTKVDANGQYTVEQEQTEGKVNVGGNEQEMPSGGATSTTYKANGEVVEVKGASDDNANSFRMANLGLLIDPGKELKVGDTWAHEVKADTKTGAVSAKAQYKLVGEEKVGDVDTLKVEATVTESEGAEPASSKSVIWLDKKDRSVVKLESEWKNAPFPGAPANLNAKVKLTRIG